MMDSARLRIINAAQRREIATLREQMDQIQHLSRRVRMIERSIAEIMVYLGNEATRANTRP